MNWNYGHVIETPITKKWSKEKMDEENLKESLLILSDFTTIDKGASRQLVCQLNPNHNNFTKNRIIIRHTPEYYEILKEINRLLSNGIEIHPLSPIHEKVRKLIFD
jgi:hypothetical protein